MQIDHTEPAVPLTGWESFDSFIERLFVPVEGLRAICKPHHEEITKGQTEIRKTNRKLKKIKK
jgi:hypothetical protein